jgi:hypothetical protein
MNKKIGILLTVALALTAFTTGCEEDADNKMAAAQKCLDDLNDVTSTNTDALACEAKIAGIETPESYVVRCGVRFFVGGLKTSTILAAFDAYENAAENDQASVLMDALSQSDATAAQNTFDSCKKSGVSSLIYISSASLAGTMVADLGVGATLDDRINSCIAGNCNDTQVGTAVIALSNSYCVGDAKETPVCSEIASAISAAGGANADPATIADYLYQYLQ